MSSPPGFIRPIIHPESDFLEIPDEFIRRYSRDLPCFVHFMVPTGSLWTVKVVRSNDGQILFGDGWKMFKEYYSIGEGHFLAFDYFHTYNYFVVLIFGNDGTESRYRVDGQAGTSTDIYCHSFISAEPPKFCLMIEDLTSDILRIPPEFTKIFRQDLPGTMFLKVPGCSWLWKVELIRELDGEIWLENGCKEFMDYYNIDFGHSLLFEYYGESSRFDVLIFDMDSTEIDYALANVEDGSDSSEWEDSGEDDQNDQESEMNIDTSREFSQIMKHHNTHRFVLDKEFTIGTGIREDMTVMVQNGAGRKWRIEITALERHKYALCSGWNQFLIDNGVTVGSTVSFKWVSSRLIEARVVEKGSEGLFKYVDCID